jgi:hypothetical protein
MVNKWATWLSELDRAGKGGVSLRPAIRERSWVLRVSFSGDNSAATFRGEVRISPDTTGDPLAAFSFSTPEYDSELDKTSVSVSLAAGTGANSTGSLPSDDDANGVEEFPFDILMTPSGGAEEVLIAGVLPVLGRVTV